MRCLAVATLILTLSVGPGASFAADEEAPATGGFGPAGAFGTLRGGHSATLLQDGRVLFVGDVAAAEVWDPETESFGPAGSLSVARDGPTALPLSDGRALVVGGCCSGKFGLDTAQAEIFDPASDRISPAGTLAIQREHHTITLLPDDRVLITGGFAADRSMVDVERSSAAEIWDPGTMSFSPAGVMLEPRVRHDATLLADGRVLITGDHVTTAEVWDPATSTFSATGSPIEPRADGYTATSLSDGRVLFIGGVLVCEDRYDDGCPASASAEVWDPATDAFAPAGSLTAPRYEHSATLLPDGRVLVIGGWGGEAEKEAIPSEAEIWDPVTNDFSPAGVLAVPRGDPSVTLLPDGRALVVGGADTDDLSGSAAELWDPERTTSDPSPSPIGLDRKAAEAALLEGVRRVIADTCKPTRSGVPKSALGAIECRPDDVVVDRVRVYLFASEDDLLDAYFDRLAEQGLGRGKAHRGRCEPGKPSEGPYHPTTKRERADYPYRSGCFVDGKGRAHYLATTPPLVLAEVTGSSGDISAAEGWSWRGNKGDVPGGPRIWG